MFKLDQNFSSIETTEGVEITGPIHPQKLSKQDTLKIPEEIGGRPVVSIGESAFEGFGFTNIELPNELKKIGPRAFKGNQLREIIFPENTIEISGDAFRDNQITRVELPDSTRKISDGSFYNNKIRELTIGKNVEVIGSSSFTKNEIKELIIPPKVREVGEFAFKNNLISYFELEGRYTELGNGIIKKNLVDLLELPVRKKKSYNPFKPFTVPFLGVEPKQILLTETPKDNLESYFGLPELPKSIEVIYTLNKVNFDHIERKIKVKQIDKQTVKKIKGFVREFN